VIGFLRFIGTINAAIWLGGAVFFTFVAGPFFSSSELQSLLGDQNYPFFAVTFRELLAARYFQFNLACAAIAWLHLVVEWLYLGQPPRKGTFGLLALLSGLMLLYGAWLQPLAARSHMTRHRSNVPAVERTDATRAFQAASTSARVVNFCVMSGLFVFAWRITRWVDSPRLIPSVKFRG
jgi:hypothetical protein